TRGTQTVGRASPHLLDTIYECEARQEWYRDFAIANGEEAVVVVGSTSIDDDPATVGTEMRRKLSYEPGRRGSSWSDAFRHLSEHAEELGVLVMTSGIVGSNTHRALDPDEFGGFALVDTFAPVVFVNGTDTKAAQIFTLAHELAHVWLGGSALDDAQPGTTSTQAVEQWCNAVAGELLVPGSSVAMRSLGSLDADELDALAAEFRVSTLVVLRRLLDLGRVSQQVYWARYDAERARLAELAAGGTRSGGGNFYNTQPVRTSKRFARALIADTLEGRTLYRDAFRMLGFKKESTFTELARTMGVV
ncbi:MAG: ImmA/IrrE family metallo-endopeptidase, partial [Nocardioides sp.]